MNEKSKARLGWTVVAGLSAARVGLYLLAPNLVAALPIVLLATCPLSMLVLMKMMQGSQSEVRGRWTDQESNAGLTREEGIDRLRAQQATLSDQIDALERDEPPRSIGRQRRPADVDGEIR